MPEMNKIDAVIFDMDGVIVDSHPVHRKAWRLFLQNLGRDVSDTELEFIVDGRKRSEILRYFLGDIPDNVLLKYGCIKDEIFQRMAFEVKPVPGVIEFILDLARHEVRVAVATSASRSRTLSTLSRLQLIESISIVVTGDDVSEGKSSAAIYERVRDRLFTVADYCLVVEDSVSAVRAAKQAGFRCIGIGSSQGTKLHEAGADHVIENFVGFSLGVLQNNTQPKNLRI
jgi:HAD superfamily hydrolase (TIGR01509 family)